MVSLPGETEDTSTSGTTTSSTSSEVSAITSGEYVPPENSGLGDAITPESMERNDVVSQTVLTNLTDPQIPDSAVQTYTNLDAQDNEFADPTDDRFQVGNTADPLTAATGTAQDAVEVPDNVTANTYDAATIGEGAAGSEQAATAVDPAAAAVAALGDLPEEALVQSQMEELTAGLESGDIPTWAQPAVDAVEAQLAARGLSRSSVGQAALTNAIIQSALPMAQQNATAITNNFAQDKNNQQQANMLNAQTSAQLQLQSLTNEQQMAIQNSNLRQQAMLSDQAALNAAGQFNATSQNQTDQFMANLQASIETQNAARLDTMSQFNAQQDNAMSQFVSNQQFAREQFNAQNATAIEQSNLQWRRQVNQINTAGENAVNQANAMNAFNLSNQSLTFMWQELRDQAKWSFEATQNEAQRAAALAQAAMGNEASMNAANVDALKSLGLAALNFFEEPEAS